MIKHHPSPSLLEQFAAGRLPASLSVVVASHIEACGECRKNSLAMTEQAALEAFCDDEMLSDTAFVDRQADTAPPHYAGDLKDGALATIEAITELAPGDSTSVPEKVREIDVSGDRLPLPRALNSINLNKWQALGGKLSRSRLALDDDNLKSSLLHIDEGGSVPSHTHKGFEVTLLLQGSYEDEMGEYHQGDFIWLDGKHTHQPVSKEGCVCLIVSSDAMHFTGGLSQLLNPIGRFIY